MQLRLQSAAWHVDHCLEVLCNGLYGGCIGIMEKKMETTYGISYKGYMGLLEVLCTYNNLLSNCSYNPIKNPMTTVALDIIV